MRRAKAEALAFSFREGGALGIGNGRRGPFHPAGEPALEPSSGAVDASDGRGHDGGEGTKKSAGEGKEGGRAGEVAGAQEAGEESGGRQESASATSAAVEAAGGEGPRCVPVS